MAAGRSRKCSGSLPADGSIIGITRGRIPGSTSTVYSCFLAIFFSGAFPRRGIFFDAFVDGLPVPFEDLAWTLVLLETFATGFRLGVTLFRIFFAIFLFAFLLVDFFFTFLFLTIERGGSR